MAKPVVAIVGRPNVGKSTLFNKLIGSRLSIVDDTPGVTRDRIYGDCEWLNHKFLLVDTGGIEPNTSDVILSQMRTQAEIAIKFIESEGNLNDDTIIVTHDSVRPFVTNRIIEENIEFAKQYGACDTVVPATDTIVESADNEIISSIPDRSKMYQGQTPQSFNALKLKNIYNSLTADEKDILTDAAKIFVIKGEKVALVQGETYNMKITYPYDLKVAKSLLEDESDD